MCGVSLVALKIPSPERKCLYENILLTLPRLWIVEWNRIKNSELFKRHADKYVLWHLKEDVAQSSSAQGEFSDLLPLPY